jgi:hypothetical protein
VFADTCSAKLTSYNAPQFFLLSDGVFAGAVQHIDNTTDHQWKVYFTVDKLWRGSVSQKPLVIMTTSLQGCGYSIVQGEKYLVYTNGYPPFFNTVWSKPYADAQSDIAIIDDPKFQSSEKIQEELNKKLEIAKDAISNLMGSRMEDIPFNAVGVDVINSTLDVGIESTKATLSEEEYLKKIKEIVGDIPIKITFGEIVAGVGDGTTQQILSPLQQFNSGIAAKDVNCVEGLQLITKAESGSPACVKPDHAYILIYRGWAKEFIQSVTWSNQSTCSGIEVPSGDYRGNIFPVLMMSPNSTAVVCVTYNFKSDWESYPNKDVYPHGILETCCFVHIGWYSTPVGSNKFEILANPPLFNVTGVYNGSKISVTYKIYAKSDSTGLYDTSIPFDECLSHPLAVGYDPSKVDPAKFHSDFGVPCFNTIDNVDSVKIISGMTYKEVQFP